jgi:hypothetical protein
MAAKRQAGSAQAVIEVWREGDRVLIGVPSFDNPEYRSDNIATESRQRENDQVRPAREIAEMLRRLEKASLLMPSQSSEERAESKRRPRRQADAGRVEAEMFVMTEEEWLTADLLALQHEARELAKSLDNTLAHITAGCAAIKAG